MTRALTHLRDLIFGAPKAKPNPEQAARLAYARIGTPSCIRPMSTNPDRPCAVQSLLYPPERRRVRRQPTRRNVNRKGADAA